MKRRKKESLGSLGTQEVTARWPSASSARQETLEHHFWCGCCHISNLYLNVHNYSFFFMTSEKEKRKKELRE